MNTCDTCKWWDNEPRDKYEASPETRACNHSKVDYFAEGNDACVCHDAEGYSGYITTGPKFGCVHWEAK